MARDVQQENIYERKTKVCNIFETDLKEKAPMLIIHLTLFKTGFFASCDWGGAGSSLYNLKTPNDTATEIAQYNVLIISNM